MSSASYHARKQARIAAAEAFKATIAKNISEANEPDGGNNESVKNAVRSIGKAPEKITYAAVRDEQGRIVLLPSHTRNAKGELVRGIFRKNAEGELEEIVRRPAPSISMLKRFQKRLAGLFNYAAEHDPEVQRKLNEEYHKVGKATYEVRPDGWRRIPDSVVELGEAFSPALARLENRGPDDGKETMFEKPL